MRFANFVFTWVKICIKMAKIQKIGPLAFNLFPEIFIEKSRILLRIIENFSFAIWKKVFLNFVRAPQLNYDR